MDPELLLKIMRKGERMPAFIYLERTWSQRAEGVKRREPPIEDTQEARNYEGFVAEARRVGFRHGDEGLILRGGHFSDFVGPCPFADPPTRRGRALVFFKLCPEESIFLGNAMRNRVL